jgi:hypothetical protein
MIYFDQICLENLRQELENLGFLSSGGKGQYYGIAQNTN